MKYVPHWWDAAVSVGESWPSSPEVEPLVHGWTVHEGHLGRLLSPLIERWNTDPDANRPVVLEIGSWLGKTAVHLLSTYPDLLLLVVDAWRSDNGINHERSTDSLRTWQANVFPYRERVVAVRDWSECGMLRLRLAGAVPDVVYVDAAHDYASVYLDVATAVACFPRALICGDDYPMKTRGEDRSVGDAVEAYAKRRGREVVARGRFWEMLP